MRENFAKILSGFRQDLGKSSYQVPVRIYSHIRRVSSQENNKICHGPKLTNPTKLQSGSCPELYKNKRFQTLQDNANLNQDLDWKM
jgi:hypothetical protein